MNRGRGVDGIAGELALNVKVLADRADPEFAWSIDAQSYSKRPSRDRSRSGFRVSCN